MEKTYLVLYTYDARGNGRYRTYALQTPFKEHVEYALGDTIRIEVTDQAGKDAIYLMVKVQSKHEFTYGQTIMVEDPIKSEQILQDLPKLIVEKAEAIKASLENRVTYDSETKSWPPPTDPFL